VPADEGFVVALYGAWGSGKTSVLNLVETALAKQRNRSTDTILVVRFNPWWFSGDDAILREFLSHLETEITTRWHWPNPAKITRAFQVLAAHLASVGGAALGVALPLVNPAAAPRAKSIETVTKQIKPPATPTAKEARDELVEALRGRNGRVVVLLDDIDRLRQTEVQAVFRLIKAVAQFPNTVYLLAFDQDIVVHALRDVGGPNAYHFLEKIVQVGFTIPPPDAADLDRLLDEDLASVVGKVPSDLFSASEWRTLRLGVLRHLIRTPRDVARFVNAVALTYPVVRGEVHVVDFLGVQALRTFAPEVYNAIRLPFDSSGRFLFGGGSQPGPHRRWHTRRFRATPPSARRSTDAYWSCADSSVHGSPS
jgi:predicted KAP-like P-loop ATPase